MMKDNYGRTIDYLRISITDRCNLRCVYCMPEEGITCIPHKEILSYEEIQTICQKMAEIGLKHIRITGGEPLVRKECWNLIQRLKENPLIETVTLTTNGILLAEMAEKLVQAGVDGINISLDTLDQIEYAQITRGGDVKKVLEGLKAILNYPQVTTKINCVVGGEGWEKRAVSIAELAKNNPVHVRFIEYMPTDRKQLRQMKLQDEVRKLLESVYGLAVDCEKPFGFGPSSYYQLEGFLGKIGFISAMSHKFCETCNRLRLTADGKLRLCLQSSEMIDLKSLLRQGNELELIAAIQAAIDRKPKEHHLEESGIETVSMSQIGG